MVFMGVVCGWSSIFVSKILMKFIISFPCAKIVCGSGINLPYSRQPGECFSLCVSHCVFFVFAWAGVAPNDACLLMIFQYAENSVSLQYRLPVLDQGDTWKKVALFFWKQTTRQIWLILNSADMIDTVYVYQRGVWLERGNIVNHSSILPTELVLDFCSIPPTSVSHSHYSRLSFRVGK